MTRFHKFVRLRPGDRTLLVRAMVLVAAIPVALRVLPFPYLFRLLDARRRSSSRALVGRQESAARLAWGVRTAARLLPGASCLTQSLALHRLLVRAGHSSEVHIGVATDPQSGLSAHAWVEHAGSTWLTAPAEAARYTRLLSWGRPQT
jgi:hypothetical protein